MAFTVTKTDGSTLAIVYDNSVNDTSSSITLHGRAKLRWGNAVNENFVHMLENFAHTSAPALPLEGQLWAAKTVGSPIVGSPQVETIRFWDGTSWIDLLTASLGSDIYVDETGDTMTGDLILDAANLNVSNGSVTISSDGSPSGSPRTIALSVDGNIEAKDSIMTFTGLGVDTLIINQGKGSVNTGPDIYAPPSSARLLLAADQDIYCNINGGGGSSGSFWVKSGGLTNAADTIFEIDNNGHVLTAGNGIEIGLYDDTDKNSYVDFHAHSGSGDYSSRIIRTPGTNNNFILNNTGTGGILLQRNGSSELSITSTSISMGSNRVSSVATPSAGTDAANKDYVDGIGLGGTSQSWSDVTGSRSAGIIYTNSTGQPIYVLITYNTVQGLQGRLEVPAGTARAQVSSLYSGQTLGNNVIGAIVPDGSTYRAIEDLSWPGSFGSITRWHELR